MWKMFSQSCQEKDAKYSDTFDRFVHIEADSHQEANNKISMIAPGVAWNTTYDLIDSPSMGGSHPSDWMRRVGCKAWCECLTPRRPYRVHMYYKNGDHEIYEHNCQAK